MTYKQERRNAVCPYCGKEHGSGYTKPIKTSEAVIGNSLTTPREERVPSWQYLISGGQRGVGAQAEEDEVCSMHLVLNLNCINPKWNFV